MRSRDLVCFMFFPLLDEGFSSGDKLKSVPSRRFGDWGDFFIRVGCFEIRSFYT